MSNYALRLPESLIQAAKRLAEREGTSMNQLFVMAIAEKLATLETAKLFSERGARAAWKSYDRAMRKVRNVPPMAGDELPQDLR